MSILLESLNKKSTQTLSKVPTLSDHHFDEEALIDEGTNKKQTFWRLFSVVLLLLLVLSWSSLYIRPFKQYFQTLLQVPFSSSTHTKSLLEKKTIALQKNNPNTTAHSLLLTPTNHSIQPSLQKKTPSVIQTKKQKKISYKPIKKVEPKLQQSVNKMNTKGSKQTSLKKSSINIQKKSHIKENSSQKVAVKKTSSKKHPQKNIAISLDDALLYQDLSDDIHSKLPELNIASYAISTKKKKSFIFLNNKFYNIGEHITPNLKLIAIDQTGIFFKYNTLLFKKEHS
jgi:hypothetical protein